MSLSLRSSIGQSIRLLIEGFSVQVRTGVRLNLQHRDNHEKAKRDYQKRLANFSILGFNWCFVFLWSDQP